MPLNVYAIGASRNIGYYSAIRLLNADATVTFLLRSGSSDETVQKFVEQGKAQLVKGDGLNEADVKRGWEKASARGPVDFVLFTVGGTPKFDLMKGAIVTPENLVTQCLINVLCSLSTPYPNIVTISSTGLTKMSHDSLPLLLKPVYSYLLSQPHKDKLGAERVVSHCAGWKWHDGEPEPGDDIMGANWRERPNLPPVGSIANNILVVRPALLTDGDCEADKQEEKRKKKDQKKDEDKKKEKPAYRVSEGELTGGWTVSRKEVAHFVADAILNRWDEFSGKIVSIAY